MTEVWTHSPYHTQDWLTTAAANTPLDVIAAAVVQHAGGIDAELLADVLATLVTAAGGRRIAHHNGLVRWPALESGRIVVAVHGQSWRFAVFARK